MKFFEQVWKKKSPPEVTKMSVISLTKFNDKENGLKSDFEKKYEERDVSGSSEKLKEYKFLSILGQGAFGIVVSYDFIVFSLTSYIFRFLRNL